MSLADLIQNFPLFSEQEKTHIENTIENWTEDKKEKFKVILMKAYKIVIGSQQKAREELEKFQHQKLNPLFKKREYEDRTKERGNLQFILHKLKDS